MNSFDFGFLLIKQNDFVYSSFGFYWPLQLIYLPFTIYALYFVLIDSVTNSYYTSILICIPYDLMLDLKWKHERILSNVHHLY